MTPANPRLVDRLASEYVLGTLRGAARRRFERWRAAGGLAAERCRFWEENLMYLAKELRPIRPPAHVWQSIQTRLDLQPPARRRSVTRLVAMAASVLLVIGLATMLYWRAVSPGRLADIATISASSGALMWQIEVYGDGGRLIVHGGEGARKSAGHDYELWALPAGGAPVSLGVLPVGGSSDRNLTDAQRRALLDTAQVAVTLEQAGGSPTGQPTRTPLFVVPLRTVS